MSDNIFDFIRSARDAYSQDSITIVEGLDYSQYEVLRLVELYSNSKYLSGQQDSLGRDKPFYNVVDRLVTLSDTAEDIDRKDITMTSDDPENYIKSFMFTKENHRWMEKSGFGQTLNDMTHTRGKYGGVLVKKTETEEDLYVDVVDWRLTITDQADIVNGVIIERHFYTPSQLLKEGKARDWNMDNVRKAIRKHTEYDQDDDEHEGSSFDGRKTHTPYIEVWEAHGVFPKSYAASEEEIAASEAAEEDLDHEYEDRVFIISNLDAFTMKDDGRIYENDCVLFTEVEDERPYKYLPYERVPGRGLGIGRVEKAFESQTWTNDIILKQKDILDLASKTLFVTDDQKAGRNVLKEKRVGDIIKVQTGKQFNTLNTTPQALAYFSELLNQWNTQLERASSTYAANTGDSLPSGTPYRLGAILNEEANSIFNDRRDEMGIFIGEIYRDWVIPYLKKRLSKKHVLVADFDIDELQLIDDSFVNFEVKQRFLDKLFSTKSLEEAEMDLAMYEQEARERVSQTKSKRFLDIPDGYYDDVEFDLSVEVTNEKRMKAVYLETLSNILTTVTNTFDPNTGTFKVLDDPKLSRLFNQIMETAGYSPVELQATPVPQTAPIQQQQSVPQVPELQSPSMQLAEFGGTPMDAKGAPVQ